MRMTSAISVGSNCMSRPAMCELEQVSAVGGLRERLRQLLEVSGIDVAGAKGYLLRATHLLPLPALNGLDEHRGLQQGLMGARVQPCYPTPEQLDAQAASC